MHDVPSPSPTTDDRELRALSLIRQLRDRVSRLETERREPIAVVGMSCRFPGGVETPEEYWEALRAGRDLVGEPPEDRSGGDAPSARGGFIRSVYDFDADFFGIAPKEALRMDPQQRLLLEVSWEAFERAGYTRKRLQGSRTAVYVGLSTDDYFHIQTADPGGADMYSATGTDASFAAGRLSYFFDLRGPCLSLSTFCSSSLVAVNEAVRSLRGRDCDMALAAAVNVILWPTRSAITAKFGALSPTGACRPFDARADGFVRSEGCGVVVLRRLSDALADGNPILAVVLGSAVNHDGTSLGLTAPNGAAQEAAMREALRDAGTRPEAVTFVETHGTGTALGDPIEAESLVSVYGGGTARPCALGAVKGNLGHAEAAAGMAGFIKTILCLKHGALPPNLHFRRMNERIDLRGSGLFVPTALREWEKPPEQRFAAVSSFGMSGTNAHVILGAAPPRPPEAVIPEGPRLFKLSARSTEALRDYGLRCAAAIESLDDERFALACATANEARSDFEVRACVIGSAASSVASGLRALAEDRVQPGGDVFTGVVSRVPKVGFLFTGQGSQYARMGSELYAESPVFRAVIDRAAAALGRVRDRTLHDVLADEAALSNTLFTQPAIYAVSCGLVEMVRGWGIEPDVVCGHSVGEYAAAYAAGVFGLEEGMRLIAARARLMVERCDTGAMLGVSGTVDGARGALGALNGSLDIAAVNGPRDFVLSGTAQAVERAEALLRERGVPARRLAVSHAFHSRLMEPMLEAFEREAEAVTYEAPRCCLVSGVTGQSAGRDELSAAYFRRHVRESVRFSDAVRLGLARGVTAWVELGPKPALLSILARDRSLGSFERVATLRQGKPERDSMMRAAASLYVHGAPVDFSRAAPSGAPGLAELPTYPFQRKRFVVGRALEPARTEQPLHAVTWIAAERAAPALPPPLGAEWLVLTGGSLGERIAEALRSTGSSVRSLELAPGVDAGSAVAAFVSEPRAAGGIRRVVFAPSAGDSMGDSSSVKALASVCATLAPDPSTGVAVHLVTSGAQAVSDGEAPNAAAAAWGFARSAALELGERWGGAIDVGDDDGAVNAARDELLTPSRETEVAYRQGRRYVSRVVPAPHAASRAPLQLASDKAYLVTGGTGVLGLLVAERLVRRGARHVYLAGRRGLDGVAGPERARLDAMRAVVDRLEIVAADVGDRAAVAGLLARIQRDGVQLGGVVHAAGVGSAAMLGELTGADVDAAFRGKVLGALHLHELTRDAGLSLFVLFSSVAATWGASGLAHYAAANHVLDALARARRAAGLEAVSVAWGPWLGPGMGEARRETFARSGLRPLRPGAALDAMEAAVAARLSCAIAVDADWNALADTYALRSARPVFERLAQPRGGVAQPPERTGLLALTGDQRDAALRAIVDGGLCRALGYASAAEIPAARGFFELGMDSLTAVELRRAFESEIGLELPSTLLLDYPNREALSGYLCRIVAGEQEPDAAAPALAPRRSDEPIAIVGIGCRFPGDASGPEAFLRLLEAGEDAISEVPRGRWPESGPSGKAKLGGFVGDVTGFDAAFFGVSPREATNMDPQQRLVLEVCWEAVEHAGWSPASLRAGRTGVFIGAGTNDYGLGGIAGFDAAYYASGNALSALGGRVSHFLKLNGPSLVVDTACSSSAVAVHLACRALATGECDVALAGGVNLMLSPEGHAALESARMLASDGRCKTFGAEADGYGRGEGCGVIALKRVSDAERDGDAVIALVLGSAVNQNAGGAALTVPSFAAQRALIDEALARAHVSPESVQYVEAHGTGTPLGDPIEVRALAAALASERRSTPLWIGSVKTNIGHLESAAGIAGIIKTALCLERGVLPRTLHADRLNPAVPWSKLEIRPVTEARQWPDAGTGPRLAGVSSFGFTGTNAHLVLSSGAAPAQRGADECVEPSPSILTVSAATKESLESLLARYESLLDRSPAPFADVARSAREGRAALSHRVAVVAASNEEARGAIRRFLANGIAGGGLLEARATKVARLAVVFGDGGFRGLGWGRGLPQSDGAFRSVVRRCREALPREARAALDAAFEASDTVPSEVRRLALYAAQCGVAALLESWGIPVTIVLGEGAGRVAAWVAAGRITLEEGARWVLEEPDTDALERRLGPQGGAPSGAIVYGGGPLDAAVASAVGAGANVWLEVAGSARSFAVLQRSKTAGSRVATCLSAPGDARRDVKRALAFLWVAGCELRTPATEPRGARIRLPTYPFQRESFQVARPVQALPAADDALDALSGVDASSPLGTCRRLEVSVGHYPFLRDHQVHGRIVVPGSFHVAVVLAMLAATRGGAVSLQRVQFERPLSLAEDESRALTVTLGSGADGALEFGVFSGGQGAPWVKHAGGAYTTEGGALVEAPEMPAVPPDTERWDAARFYAAVGDGDLALGESFRGLRRSDRRPGEAWSSVEPRGAGTRRYHVFPGLLDAFFQSLAPTLDQHADRVFVPVSIDRLTVTGPLTAPSYEAYAVLRSASEGAASGDVSVRAAGTSVLEIAGLCVQKAPREAFLRSLVGASGALVHALQWSPRSREPNVGGAAHRWLVAGEPGALTNAICARLEASGVSHRLVPASALTVIPRGLDGFIPDRLLFVLERDGEAEVRQRLLAAHAVLRWASGEGRGAPLRVTLATVGGMRVQSGDAAEPALEAVWGLARSLVMEDPDRIERLVDLSVHGSPERQAAVLWEELAAASPEREIALRGELRYVPRLAPLALRDERPRLSDAGTFLVSGAYGALGVAVAEFLAAHGARRLVLFGRRPAGEGAASRFDALRAHGCEVREECCDVTVREEVDALYERVGRPSIRGLVHCAGVLDDASFDALSEEHLSRVLKPKAEGARHLVEPLRGQPLDCVVFFSSLSAVTGNAGQANYAAANAYLHAYAAALRDEGVRAQAVAFGPVASAGMASKLAGDGDLFIELDEALGALARVMAAGNGEAVIARLPAGKVPARLLRSGVFEARAEARPPVLDAGWLSDFARVAGASDAALNAETRAFLLRVVRGVLGSATIQDDDDLHHAGLDSLMAVEVKTALSRALGVHVPAVALLESSTVGNLASLVCREIRRSRAGASGPSPSAAQRWEQGEL